MNARRLVPFVSCSRPASTARHSARIGTAGWSARRRARRAPHFNAGIDAGATWLPADEAFSTPRALDRPDDDRCFAIMPPGGGGIFRYVCGARPPMIRSTYLTRRRSPATAALPTCGRGRIASPGLRSSRRAGAGRRPLEDPNRVRVLEAIAYLAPSGHVHQGVSHIRWLTSTRLVYLGETVTYPRRCPFCVLDTVRTGIEIVTLDLAGATPVLAWSLRRTARRRRRGRDERHHLLHAQRRFPRVPLRFSTGQTDTVHDFAAGGMRATWGSRTVASWRSWRGCELRRGHAGGPAQVDPVACSTS